MLLYVIKEDRIILVPSEDYLKEAVWELLEFFKDGVMIIMDRKFKKGYSPFRNGIEEIDVELVAKMTKLKDRQIGPSVSVGTSTSS